MAGSVLLVNSYIPVALSNSEGVGSVWVLAQLPGAHLYIQVLGNERTKRLQWARHFDAIWKCTGQGKKMTKLFGLCGALRKNSLNRQLLNEAMRLYDICEYEELSLALPLKMVIWKKKDARKLLKVWQQR